MLKRKITERLNNWKNDPHKKPLVIKGVRQCGKTFSVMDFARRNYSHAIYINFYENPEYASLFSGSLKVDDLVMYMSALLGTGAVFEEGQTIIILDEIQHCPNARTSLKFFKTDALDFDEEAQEIIADQEQTVNNENTKRRIIGIVTIILSIVPMIIINCSLTVAMFFVLVGTGVFLFVYNGSKKGLLVKIRRAQSRAQASRNRGGKRYVSTPKTKKEKYQYSDRNLSTLMPIYWEVVTCFYFGFSFLTGSWAISWLIWIAAGAVKKVIENKYGEPTGA